MKSVKNTTTSILRECQLKKWFALVMFLMVLDI